MGQHLISTYHNHSSDNIIVGWGELELHCISWSFKPPDMRTGGQGELIFPAKNGANLPPSLTVSL